VIGGGGYHFMVKVGKPKDAEAAKNGTKLARGAHFQCLMSGSPIAGDYIKAEGIAGRIGSRMIAVVAEGVRERVYLSTTPEIEAIARTAEPRWEPEGSFVEDARAFTPCIYGLKEWRHLFTPRQLVGLTTFSDQVQEARDRVKGDALAAGLRDDSYGLAMDGISATAYADAVAVYLAFAVDRLADAGSSLASWTPQRDTLRSTFARQALSMVWDFAEANPFSDSAGNITGALQWASKALEIVPGCPLGRATHADASTQSISLDKVVSTDPPYYDNVPYADLSDFFYVWLRRSLKSIFPDIFATLSTPKTEELVAFAYRHHNKEAAAKFFMDGMTRAMKRLAKQAHPAFPVTIYYAFKQSETESEDHGLYWLGNVP
jgi:putative DNA methylase